jgi:AraC-like DNA-binding protein
MIPAASTATRFSLFAVVGSRRMGAQIDEARPTLLCDTSSVRPEDRAELWVTASSEAFVPLECTPHDPGSFNGRLQGATIGPVALSLLEVSPHTVSRSSALVAETNGDRYKLTLLLGGRALVEQDGRASALRPGDFALYDCSRPYAIKAGEGFRLLVCMVPRAFISLEPQRVARMTATRIGADEGIAWAVAPFLERLADLAIRGKLNSGDSRIVENIFDLVESLCSSVIDPEERRSSRAELLLRARAYADAHLGDASLSPAAIADGIHVSKRYLHLLFEEDGSTVSGWVRWRRLQRCRRDLIDPTRADETVASIGARWGMTNPSHLSRAFREAYGLTPSEYRDLH